MLFAKVVLGLAVEGPFDYIVPPHLSRRVRPGMRVAINLRQKKMTGYVVALSKRSVVKNLKEVLDILDDFPTLDKDMLALTHGISDYYCCSWGEVIETALPSVLRKKKRLSGVIESGPLGKENSSEVTLVHDLDERARWDFYLVKIQEALAQNRAVIILLPDIRACLKAKEWIKDNLGFSAVTLFRGEAGELEEWLKARRGEARVVVGSRSAIFAPLGNLGLIIIDEEDNPAYKQDQVPHYHARQAAFMRATIQKASLILGSSSPSLESVYLAKGNKIQYRQIPLGPSLAEVKIIDLKSLPYAERRNKAIFSKALLDSLALGLETKEKSLLFLNRKGFATFVYCHNCLTPVRCPRCNISLVYYFQDKALSCHYCNFKSELPKICPHCNAGYIKFSGRGTEKIESELSRIFPQAKIKRIDSAEEAGGEGADISVATSVIMKAAGLKFDLVAMLSADDSLNRIDFRSGEKTFALLIGLLGLARKKFLLQTRIPQHHCFQALLKKDINLFLEEELRQRQELDFPPFRHLGLIKLRAQAEEKTRQAGLRLFEALKKENKGSQVRILSLNPGQPAKLRGNFYWQILISAQDAKGISRFLKKRLKDFAHSGIIVTVDIDPL